MCLISNILYFCFLVSSVLGFVLWDSFSDALRTVHSLYYPIRFPLDTVATEQWNEFCIIKILSLIAI